MFRSRAHPLPIQDAELVLDELDLIDVPRCVDDSPQAKVDWSLITDSQVVLKMWFEVLRVFRVFKRLNQRRQAKHE